MTVDAAVVYRALAAVAVVAVVAVAAVAAAVDVGYKASSNNDPTLSKRNLRERKTSYPI